MAEGNVATPFLEMRSFVREDSEVFLSETLAPTFNSPFVSVYELEGRAEFLDPQEEAYSTLVQDLYDEEFDEALFELMVQARGVHEEHMLSTAHTVEGERLLNQHFSQLIREAEATVSAFERQFGSRDAATLGEAELEAFAEGYSPSTTLTPEFEEFLGKWKKKLVGLAKKAGKFAKKLGLDRILAQVKKLIGPLLNKVLQMAIGKLPEELQPAAEQLADKIFKRVPKKPADDAAATDAAAVSDPAAMAQAAAGPDVTGIQQELDHQLANLFLVSDEAELELEVARLRNDERQPAAPVYSDLDGARERFINELQQLKEGEDAAPYIQNFLPAVLPALRIGIRVIGRPKIVDMLAKLLAKLIAKLIGPESAPALSRAIVDAGLKLLTLEVSPQDEARAAASSVAATVEETMRRVAALPEYVLDNQELLEGFALEAFERAAAANLPPVLSEEVYRTRPDLLESDGRTCWIMLPLRRRKRYKKCGRTFKVRITPYMAGEIESFAGPLADHLHDQLGVEQGAEVEAEVSLYETLPGTVLPDIAREEAETSKAVASGAGPFHPLTTAAAGLLLGQPRLGRNAAPGTNRYNVPAGQRFYRLSIPGKRLLMTPGADGRLRPRRSRGVRVTLDCSREEIRLRVFLSEVEAQNWAIEFRRQGHAGAMAAAFQKLLGRRLVRIISGGQASGIRVLQAGLDAREALGTALLRLSPDVTAALTAKLQQCAVSAFVEFAKAQPQRLIAAAEDVADGITLKFTVSNFGGLRELGKALVPNGDAAGVAEAIRGGGKPDVRIEVFPGYTR
jgi:hypothetical protein